MRNFIRMVLLLFVTVGLSMAQIAVAEEKPKPVTPASLNGGKVVDVKAAKKLWDTKNAHFFDMRSAVNFGKGHIPGAIALPYKENSAFTADFDSSVDKMDITMLPSDKTTAIIFYSDGPTGWKSYKAAVLAIKAGYKKVNWFREGFAGWKGDSHPVE
jgi:rhodanese-related sulfurtransferase